MEGIEISQRTQSCEIKHQASFNSNQDIEIRSTLFGCYFVCKFVLKIFIYLPTLYFITRTSGGVVIKTYLKVL